MPMRISVESARQRRRNLAESVSLRESPPGFDERRQRDANRGRGTDNDLLRIDVGQQSVPLSLSARVTDSFLAILADTSDADPDDGSWLADEIGYQCIVSPLARPGTIGYRVEVECLQPEFVASLLQRVPESWHGVETVVRYGEVPSPAGFAGKMGGVVGFFDSYSSRKVCEFGVTCNHVEKSPVWKSLYHPTPDMRVTSSPDIKLIDIDGQGIESRLQVSCAENAIIEAAMLHRTRATKAPIAKPDGVVMDLVESFPHLGRINRFPSCRMQTLTRSVMGLRWPRSHFSSPGRSGSWVLDPKLRQWLGVIVAGRPASGDAYIHRSAPLLKLIQDLFGPSTAFDPELGALEREG